MSLPKDVLGGGSFREILCSSDTSLSGRVANCSGFE